MSKVMIEVDLSGWRHEKITAVYVAREDGQQHLPDFRIVTQPSAEPVAWLEGQPSLRGVTPTSLVFLTHSTNLHTREPQTTNPVWPLYAHPPAQGEALRRIAERLRAAGAVLPAGNEGTIESAHRGGLSIALLLVEQELAALAQRGEVGGA